jgi:M6 family metalloprotease-like protein
MQLTGLAAALLIPGVALAITPPPRNGVIPDHLRARIRAIQAEYAQGYWYERAEQRRLLRASQTAGERFSSMQLEQDTVYAPMLLGRYNDVQEKFSAQAFQALLFDGPNPSGTVTDFYLDNSYGQLYFTGTAEGWFVAPRAFDYYVHDGENGLDYGGRDFTIDILAASDSLVDYARYVKYYDAQGRGHVPQLGIVHTGADAAAGADNIWSHRWNIRGRLLERKGAGSDPYFDVGRVTPEGWYITDDLTSTGKAVLIDGDYAIEPELSGSGNSGNDIIKIGVFVHEFGHVFGLPDLYDTDGSSEGLGNWCVMAGGSWGADGRHAEYPSNFSAWCKEQLGWVTPTIVTSFLKKRAIRHSEEFPEIYKLWRLGSPGSEYFLVENRQRVKSDRYLMNTGLLIYHVDNSRSNNRNEDHYLVDLEQADGNRDLNRNVNRGDAGDPFPGTTNNRRFERDTKPNSRDYTGAETYVGVRQIDTSGLTVMADLDVGTHPFVVVKSLNITEAAGANNNGRVEQDEQGNLHLRVANIYPTNGVDLTLSVASLAPGASGNVSVPLSINGLAEDTLTIERFLSVDHTFIPQEVNFAITIAAPEDTLHYLFTAVIGYPSLLLVNRDTTNEDIDTYYRTAADACGRFHETFQAQGPSLSSAALDKRDIVIYFTGRKRTETIPDSVEQALTSFFNAGKQLLISGQNIAEDLHSTGSPFLQNPLHADWSRNILIGRFLYGVGTDLIGGRITKLFISSGNGASNQTSPDELLPDSLAHSLLLYGSATSSSVAGVWYEDPVSRGKVVFLGFGFEAINDSGVDVNSRHQLLTSILDWFSGVTGTPAGDLASTLPGDIQLFQNYPNPFNPSTVVRYQLPGESHVKLAVFDVLGREMAMLVNEKLRAGRYEATFDATGLASGVYFYRLEVAPVSTAKAYASTRSMLLLR